MNTHFMTTSLGYYPLADYFEIRRCHDNKWIASYVNREETINALYKLDPSNSRFYLAIDQIHYKKD